MTPLSWIITVCFFGGTLSVLAAAYITGLLGMARITLLVSYAIGAMLGAVFLEIMPHAFSSGYPVDNVAAIMLAGILGFFLLEKLVIWRHCHANDTDAPCEAHGIKADETDHGRSGMMILIGDTFHNFVDGILIAAAFLENSTIGIVTAVAIITHSVPQALSSYLVLLHSGFRRTHALLFNLLASLAMLVGGITAYSTLQTSQHWIPVLLALAVSSMVYVAIADLMPGLHRRTELRATIQQVILILAGVATVWIIPELLGGHEHNLGGHEHSASSYQQLTLK